MDALRLIAPAPTLGDLRTLTLYPAVASHRGLTPEERHAVGIGDGLVRLSVGIEEPADLIEDSEAGTAGGLGSGHPERRRLSLRRCGGRRGVTRPRPPRP